MIQNEFVNMEYPPFNYQFLGKVYSLLSLQLVITTCIATLCMKVNTILVFVTTNFTPFYYSMVLMFIELIALFCYKNVYPINIIFLHLFTITNSYMVGVICAIFESNNQSDIILYSFGITISTFICLTAYVLTTKTNFNFLHGYLSVMLCVLICHGIIALIIGFQTSIVYSICGIAVFTGYILFDTSMLLYTHNEEDYVIIVILLYLDIINFFLKMVDFLSKMSKCIKN